MAHFQLPIASHLFACEKNAMGETSRIGCDSAIGFFNGRVVIVITGALSIAAIYYLALLVLKMCCPADDAVFDHPEHEEQTEALLPPEIEIR